MCDLVESLEQALVVAAARLRGERLKALLDAIERVLDRLEPLADRAHAPRQALDVGRRRDVERAHRHVLGLDGLLARVEGPLQRGGHERVARQLLGQLPERLLTLAGEALANAFLLGLVHERQSSQPAAESALPPLFPEEKKHLGNTYFISKLRLSCRLRVEHDLAVTVLRSSTHRRK